jgi:hypothetical protein
MTLSPRAAHADLDFTPFVAGAVVDGAVVLAGVVTLVGTATDLRSRPTSRAWRYGAYATGVLNTAMGLVLLGFVPFVTDDARTFTAIAGPSQLAIGVGNLVLGYLSGRAGRSSISLAPIGGRDARGTWAGIGFRLARF